LVQFNGCTISRTWYNTVAEKTKSKGSTAMSIVARILFDLSDDSEMSSLEDRSETRSTAINAPPTPPLMTVVIDTALDAALDDSDEAAITKLISFFLYKIDNI
jgi:hypothetical protein